MISAGVQIPFLNVLLVVLFETHTLLAHIKASLTPRGPVQRTPRTHTGALGPGPTSWLGTALNRKVVVC